MWITEEMELEIKRAFLSYIRSKNKTLEDYMKLLSYLPGISTYEDAKALWDEPF
jgi:hypothetical protein